MTGDELPRYAPSPPVAFPVGKLRSPPRPTTYESCAPPKRRTLASSIVSPMPNFLSPSLAPRPVSGLTPSPLTKVSGTRRPTWRRGTGETAASTFHVNMSLMTLVLDVRVALGSLQFVLVAQLTTTNGFLA